MLPRQALVVATSVLLALPVLADDTVKTAAADDTEIEAAEKSFHAGNYEAAAQKYRAVLTRTPASTTAQAGIARSTLRLERLDEALAMALKYEASAPNDAEIHSVLGEIHFRRAEMHDAEVEFRKAIALDARAVRAYLGLAELLDALALHRKAYEELVAARAVAPDDPEVQRRWLRLLPRKSRIAALENYLTGPHEENAEDTQDLTVYLAFLKSSGADGKTHACKLAKPVEKTQTDLYPLMVDPVHLRGWGLRVRLNDHVAKLLVDTGASGILIGRRQAEKAGVVRISEDRISGIGDNGAIGGYYGYVDRLKIGELEFHDCVIEVSDKRSIADEEDGLIGADVFDDYIVNLDFREARMRLDPLPKRPDEAAENGPSLNSEGDDESMETAGTDAAGEVKSAAAEVVDLRTYVPKHLPKDRYVPQEMKTWSPVWRFGHDILVPTRVNNLPNTKLFLLDTGAFNNTFATTLARGMGKMGRNEDIEVHGISGKVEKVYRAKDATLEFGHLRQKVEDGVTFDISSISRSTGTEVSGILGLQCSTCSI